MSEPQARSQLGLELLEPANAVNIKTGVSNISRYQNVNHQPDLNSEAGWPIDWSDLNPDANEGASMASHRGDNGPLRRLLDGLVAR